MIIKHKYKLGEYVQYKSNEEMKKSRIVAIKARTTREHNYQVIDYDAEPAYRLEGEMFHIQEHFIISSLEKHASRVYQTGS